MMETSPSKVTITEVPSTLPRIGDKVLTLDTDSFIVGDRVWVNGVRPGHIAYLGETRFAPGEWAGVVLDDATGKNDGAVGGKRYFYCGKDRGVFSRLWRLTRYPLISDTYLSRSPSPTLLKTSENIYRTGILRSKSVERRSPLVTTTTFSRDGSPTRCSSSASTRSIRFSSLDRPEKTVTTVTTTTTDGYKAGPLRVGEKVYVNSTKGVLSGRLRFLGHTDFAPGYWAGVELDEPMGKNDGAIAGKRYFWCPNYYGLFAPAYKVLKADPKKVTTVTRVERASPEI